MPYIQFQFRRGTAAEWASANPILASGELGLETDTKKIKIGDGVTHWNDLHYGVGAIDLQNATETGNTTNVAISVTNSAVSSNSVTGALTVAGGVGIGGDLNLAGNIKINGLSTVGNTLVPTGNGVVNIGTPTNRFGTVYVSGNSVDLGGTVLSANTGTLYINNVAVQAGNDLSLNSATFGTGVTTPQIISNGATYTVGTSVAIIDQFPVASYTTAKYIVQAVNGSNYHSMEAFLVNDGNFAWLTVYASLKNNVKLLDLDTSIVSGNVRLLATGTGAGNSVKVFVTRI